MFVQVHMGRISLVSLDNKKNDQVFSKVILKQSDFLMMSHPTGESYMEMQIKALEGYSLFQKNDLYYEKGFIDQFTVTKTYQPRDLQHLREMFKKDLEK